MATKQYDTVLLNKENGIAWVTFNRPEKRNAMNPQLHFDMENLLLDLEPDPEVQVIVLTGAGPAWCAGMDLKEFFRGTDSDPVTRFRAGTSAQRWYWDLLNTSSKSTIAMVNGYCFGGGFIPLCACDIAIAAEDAVFGLSEVNWGIVPGGIVSKVVADMMAPRDAVYYAMTGDTFTGRQAAEMRLVNFAVPLAGLRDKTLAVANNLMTKNPLTVAYTKKAVKAVRNMPVAEAYDYLMLSNSALRWVDKEGTRDQGIRKFIDEKKYRPGLGAVPRDKK